MKILWKKLLLIFNIQDKRDKKIKSNDISNKNHDNNDNRTSLGAWKLLEIKEWVKKANAKIL